MYFYSFVRTTFDSPEEASDVACATFIQTASTTRILSSNLLKGYNLPDFPPAICQKLETGQVLKEGERSAMLDAIYSSITKHT